MNSETGRLEENKHKGGRLLIQGGDYIHLHIYIYIYIYIHTHTNTHTNMLLAVLYLLYVWFIPFLCIVYICVCVFPPSSYLPYSTPL